MKIRRLAEDLISLHCWCVQESCSCTPEALQINGAIFIMILNMQVMPEHVVVVAWVRRMKSSVTKISNLVGRAFT